MIKIWTSQQAQAATGGKLLGDSNWEATGICIDSRLVKKGDLFIALKGTKTDGHDYIREAFLKGAAAVMVEHLPANFPSISPVLMVDNCIDALYMLADFRRQQTKAVIIGVTGSVGKTSTKEMLNVAFSNFGLTHATIGNNNNDIGAPLTLARMPIEAEFGIFELGMNHLNEISPLSKLVRPHISIITTVEEVHIENFKNIQEIAQAKSEIFDGMDKQGVVILNADNQFFSYLTKRAKARKLSKIIGFGAADDAQAKLIEYKDKSRESFVHASFFGHDIGYHIATRGRHMALNSLAVLAAVKAAGEDIEVAAGSLSSYSATAGRGQIIHSTLSGGREITIIDDSYNASPVSMRAALNNLGAIDSRGRKIAVIGDMLELGEKSADMHLSLAPDILINGVDKVFTVGEKSQLLFNQLPEKIRGGSVLKVEEILPILEKELKADDVVLVKASHGTHLEKVVNSLKKVTEDAI